MPGIEPTPAGYAEAFLALSARARGMDGNSLLTLAARLDETMDAGMADIWTKAKRSEVMSRIKGDGNKSTEPKLIGIFKTHGIRGWRHKAGGIAGGDAVW